MDEQLKVGLAAAYAGKSVEDIEAEIEASANVASIRDPEAVAKFLFAIASGKV